MLQVVLERPGEFRRQEAAEPSCPAGHALVRVRRVGVCGTDLHAFAGRQPFFQYPRVLGHELGVEIVAAGASERGLAAGDRCAVEPYLNCGACIACRRGKPNCCVRMRVLGVHVDGGMCELLAVPLEKLHPSKTLSFDQLALVETLGIGAHAVERAQPEAGETVLVVGAGPIGLGVVQFAQLADARVIVMDIDDRRLGFCRETLGVAHAINPNEGSVIERLSGVGDGDLPTVVLDATGHPQSMMNSLQLAAHGGRIVFVGLFQGDVTFHDPHFHQRELTLKGSRNSTPETFRRIIQVLEAGRLDTTPWITHRMSLEGVASRFSELSRQPALVKAVIEAPE
jgi:2-desacetyl-2-hydroxyethyl bacteriochlorophyllide A dehydrogenase